MSTRFVRAQTLEREERMRLYSPVGVIAAERKQAAAMTRR